MKESEILKVNGEDISSKKREKEKKLLERLISAPVEYLIRHNISPNILTYIGFLFSLLASIFLGLGFIRNNILYAWIPTILIFMSGFFDVLDGSVARKTDKESPEGAFLDSNIDRISDSILIIGLIYGNLINFFMGFIMIFLFLMISYTRSRAETEGVIMKGVGIMERAERLIILIIGLSIETWVYGIHWAFTARPFTLFFQIFIFVYIILLVITLSQRIVYPLRTLKRRENQ
ncbi:MAG: CDP-alcohol phosphatidyltransferase family protein [Candidatus Lokiarchaeota archaeon]|nr:CDP-alcohol phosphatidyltransferase family protein [Candidatus Lokiarchaeota archaeon]MBD3201833.1 CDP-alcohol phosphatidyltransferase family protein [Candidatus Lokiarchaeota archaeon]